MSLRPLKNPAVGSYVHYYPGRAQREALGLTIYHRQPIIAKVLHTQCYEGARSTPTGLVILAVATSTGMTCAAATYQGLYHCAPNSWRFSREADQHPRPPRTPHQACPTRYRLVPTTATPRGTMLVLGGFVLVPVHQPA